MRCKKHPADLSSTVGVCASCLRQRLLAIIAAQTQAQALKQAQAQQDHRKSDTDLPPRPTLSFPRSVSPYISRRKSDTSQVHHHQQFFSTPQVGPSGSIKVEIDRDGKGKKKKGGKLSSIFFGLFRSKSDKSNSGPGPIPDPVKPCSVSSPWFSTNFIAGRRKKNHYTFSMDEIKSGAQQRRIGNNRDRGMSPARHSDDEDHGGSSGYSSESSHVWKQTPQRTPASVRRCGGKAAAQSKNVSGLNFCLSPLIRASPGRHWNQKGLPSETVVAGEFRVPAKPYLSAAASFCKNRSRKLADFGRYN